MNERPRLLYPMLIVAAVAVTLLSLTGVAAMTGLLPKALATTDKNDNSMTQEKAPPARHEHVQTAAAASCESCGTVESVRRVEHKGSASGLGAVAGGVAGALIGHQFGAGNGKTVMTVAGAGGGAYLGNEVEKDVKKTQVYQIHVRMNDGSSRTLTQHEAPSVNAGDRVRVSNGAITQVL